MKKYLVIDVGGTSIKYTKMNENAEILSKGEIATPKSSLEEFINTIVDLYKKHEDIDGIAISAPGRIDAKTGYMYTGGALTYIKDCPMVDLLKKYIPVTITIDNDAKCAANAEVWKGALKNVKCGMVLTIGTGIGGGIVIDGKVHRGHNFTSGEVSFLPTSLDAHANPFKIWAMVNSTGELITKYAEVNNLNLEDVNGKVFFDAINNKNSSAIKILDEFADSFALGIYTIQTILDTETIAIGGGISAQTVLIDTINKRTDLLFEKLNWTPQKRMNIVPCMFGNDSNLIGALYHHINSAND